MQAQFTIPERRRDAPLQRKAPTTHADLLAKGYTQCACAYAPPADALTCGRCGHGVHWHRDQDPAGEVLVFAGPDGKGQGQYVRAALRACAKPLKPPELDHVVKHGGLA